MRGLRILDRPSPEDVAHCSNRRPSSGLRPPSPGGEGKKAHTGPFDGGISRASRSRQGGIRDDREDADPNPGMRPGAGGVELGRLAGRDVELGTAAGSGRPRGETGAEGRGGGGPQAGPGRRQCVGARRMEHPGARGSGLPGRLPQGEEVPASRGGISPSDSTSVPGQRRSAAEKRHDSRYTAGCRASFRWSKPRPIARRGPPSSRISKCVGIERLVALPRLIGALYRTRRGWMPSPRRNGWHSWNEQPIGSATRWTARKSPW